MYQFLTTGSFAAILYNFHSVKGSNFEFLSVGTLNVNLNLQLSLHHGHISSHLFSEKMNSAFLENSAFLSIRWFIYTKFPLITFFSGISNVDQFSGIAKVILFSAFLKAEIQLFWKFSFLVSALYYHCLNITQTLDAMKPTSEIWGQLSLPVLTYFSPLSPLAIWSQGF